MKRTLVLLLTVCLLLGSICSCAGADAPALQKDVIILFTNNIHADFDSNWGYAGVSAMKEALSASSHVILVDAGNAIQGVPVSTVTRGEAIIDIMNAVGYDIALPANNEFIYGVDRLMELSEKADFTYVCCTANREGELLFAPYEIREFDSVKIAFVGVTSPTTLRTTSPASFMDENGDFIYNFMQDETGEKLCAAVQKAVDDARAEGASYVVVLGHLRNDAEYFPWTYSNVIANTTGINVWLDGYSSDSEPILLKNRDGEFLVRFGCDESMQDVASVTITPDGEILPELYRWDSPKSAAVLLGLKNAGSEAVARAHDEVTSKLQEVVAQNTVTLYIYDPFAVDKENDPIRIIRTVETNLGDLSADAYRDQAGGADIAFVNGGGIRKQLTAGDLTLNSIMSVHPFSDSLTVIEATGRQVLEALEWSVHSLPDEFGGFLQVSGISFEVDQTIPSPCVLNEKKMFDHINESLPRRVGNVLVGGEPIDPEKIYTLASNDYLLLENGDGYTMFGGCNVLQESVKPDNQVLIDYISGTLGGVVGDGYENEYGQGRIVIVKE